MEFEDTIDRRVVKLEDSRDQVDINNSYSTNDDVHLISEED